MVVPAQSSHAADSSGLVMPWICGPAFRQPCAACDELAARLRRRRGKCGRGPSVDVPRPSATVHLLSPAMNPWWGWYGDN
eukprot:744659-Prymnesium_polylepis.3